MLFSILYQPLRITCDECQPKAGFFQCQYIIQLHNVNWQWAAIKIVRISPGCLSRSCSTERRKSLGKRSSCRIAQSIPTSNLSERFDREGRRERLGPTLPPPWNLLLWVGRRTSQESATMTDVHRPPRLLKMWYNGVKKCVTKLEYCCPFIAVEIDVTRSRFVDMSNQVSWRPISYEF